MTTTFQSMRVGVKENTSTSEILEGLGPQDVTPSHPSDTGSSVSSSLAMPSRGPPVALRFGLLCRRRIPGPVESGAVDSLSTSGRRIAGEV